MSDNAYWMMDCKDVETEHGVLTICVKLILNNRCSNGQNFPRVSFKLNGKRITATGLQNLDIKTY